jgi:hypothetical protein
MQRVLNPWDRVYYDLAAVLVLAGASAAALVILPVTVAIPMALGLGVLLFFVLRHPLLSLCISLFSRKYINTVMIGRGFLSVGFNEPDVTIPSFVNLRVERGLCGTLMIRNIRRGYAIVLPANAIPFAELKELIEGKTDGDCRDTNRY